jgi:hypothetical protein
MDATVKQIITSGWQVEPALRGSFEGILEALRRVRFMVTPEVDARKVAEFVAHVERRHSPSQSFVPRIRKVTLKSVVVWGKILLDVPDGIIGHLTRAWHGNVHDLGIVQVTSGSFEKATNPGSGVPQCSVDLDNELSFSSAFRRADYEINPTKNNWLCYDFREGRILPTHYAIRTNERYTGGPHLKSWLVETSTDGETWREIDSREDSEHLNARWFTRTFGVIVAEECRFIRLVNIGRNHFGDDRLAISAWEIFGTLLK